MRKKLDYDYCSASPILEWLGDKWALVVLLKLHENGVIRFNELYKTIPSISEKMLSTVLRSLVTDGLVNRKIYPDRKSTRLNSSHASKSRMPSSA